MAIIIYKHTNVINGKVYIGQTSVTTQSRWRNGGGYQGSPHFYAAIKKYGWINFSHEILATVETMEEANKLEQFYIQYYNSTHPDHGYNIQLGGSNHLHSEAEKLHLRNVILKKWEDVNFRQKIMQNIHPIDRSYCSQKVLCVETGKIYESQLSAAKDIGLKSSAGISKCCTGERKTAGGYHWRYIRENNNE